MRRSTSRILTTHVGSLPRPPALLAVVAALSEPDAPGGDASEKQRAYETILRDSVAELVQRQAAAGIDVVSDGELGKAGDRGAVGRVVGAAWVRRRVRHVVDLPRAGHTQDTERSRS